jgi:hypothetical protein
MAPISDRMASPSGVRARRPRPLDHRRNLDQGRPATSSLTTLSVEGRSHYAVSVTKPEIRVLAPRYGGAHLSYIKRAATRRGPAARKTFR